MQEGAPGSIHKSDTNGENGGEKEKTKAGEGTGIDNNDDTAADESRADSRAWQSITQPSSAQSKRPASAIYAAAALLSFTAAVARPTAVPGLRPSATTPLKLLSRCEPSC